MSLMALQLSTFDQESIRNNSVTLIPDCPLDILRGSVVAIPELTSISSESMVNGVE